jgi:hypothetical protein
VPIDPDVAMFAARTFERQAAERDAKRAEREARRREAEHETLLAAKDRAAKEVKRLRTLERVQAGEAAAADEAYRTALAELISFETGSAPAWAPSTEAEPETTDPSGLVESISHEAGDHEDEDAAVIPDEAE